MLAFFRLGILTCSAVKELDDLGRDEVVHGICDVDVVLPQVLVEGAVTGRVVEEGRWYVTGKLGSERGWTTGI